jgi:hypothetical protein
MAVQEYSPSCYLFLRKRRTAVRTLRRAARLHAIDSYWWLMFSGAWLAVVGAGWIGIPRVDPSLTGGPRPFETLTTISLTLPVAVHLSGLIVYSPWVESLRSVHVRGLQAYHFLFQLLSGAATMAILAWALLPPGLKVAHVIGIWVLLFSLAALVATPRTSGSVRLGQAVLFLIIVPASISGLIPWRMNLLYNGGTTNALLVIGGTLAAMATVAPILGRRWVSRPFY